jgi:hypothetical protein
MADPKLTLDDGSMVLFSDLTSGRCQDEKGNAITLTQVGSTNTYTTSYSSGGRTHKWAVEKPSDPVCRVVHTVV